MVAMDVETRPSPTSWESARRGSVPIHSIVNDNSSTGTGAPWKSRPTYSPVLIAVSSTELHVAEPSSVFTETMFHAGQEVQARFRIEWPSR